MKINTTQLVTCLKRCMQQHIVPMIHGSPGIGKSDVVNSLAKSLNLVLIDWRGSSADPTDLAGFPCLDGEKATYLPFDTFPIATDNMIPETNGWLLFADELNSAPISVQKAMYKLILDKMVGNHKLHPKVYIVAAGNLSTDGALINTLPTTLQSRMAHFEVAVCNDTWNRWAIAAGIDHRVISFIAWMPNLLHKFSPKHTNHTFPCPRTWEMASKLIKGHELDPVDLLLLTGVLSEGPAREFKAYAEVYKDLAHIKDIIANPTAIAIPTEPSTKFGMASHIAHNMTLDNASVLMEFVTRLPLEYQVILIRIAVGKLPQLIMNTEIDNWLTKHGTKKVA